jgi:hypothetical protein
MFIVPASNVSVPPTVVRRTRSSVALRDLLPHETDAAATDVKPVFAWYIQVFVLESMSVRVAMTLYVCVAVAAIANVKPDDIDTDVPVLIFPVDPAYPLVSIPPLSPI